MTGIPTVFSDTTKEIMSELDAFTFDEKSTVINLVRIMADYPGSPEEGLSKIANEARSIFSQFEGKERDLFACVRECLWALACEAERNLERSKSINDMDVMAG